MCSLGGLAHEMSEFGEDLLDGVQVGAIRRQEQEPCAHVSGGALEPDEDLVAKAFYQRVLGDVIGRRSGKDYGRSHVAICSAGPN
jgi:hypothetical protein